MEFIVETDTVVIVQTDSPTWQNNVIEYTETIKGGTWLMGLFQSPNPYLDGDKWNYVLRKVK